jgi:hypothetical protein
MLNAGKSKRSAAKSGTEVIMQELDAKTNSDRM